MIGSAGQSAPRLGAPGPASDEPPARSPELICALEAAADLARRSLWAPQAPQVGTEHVLFVLGVDRGSPTQLVLEDLGVAIPDIKRSLEQNLNPVDAPRRRRRRRSRNCNRVCSFCGRAEGGEVAVVAGPGVAICDACVELARQSVAQRPARC